MSAQPSCRGVYQLAWFKKPCASQPYPALSPSTHFHDLHPVVYLLRQFAASNSQFRISSSTARHAKSYFLLNSIKLSKRHRQDGQVSYYCNPAVWFWRHHELTLMILASPSQRSVSSWTGLPTSVTCPLLPTVSCWFKTSYLEKF